MHPLFANPPESWGFRGDPFLWKELEENLAALAYRKTTTEFVKLLESLYEKLTGVSIAANKETIYLERFDRGGMSGGCVSQRFWRETGLPLLRERYVLTTPYPQAAEMMDENTVIDVLCAELKAAGFDIQQRLSTVEQGIDLIAAHAGHGLKVLVEAKGGTSSRVGSARHGNRYTPSQVFDRVAKGIFTCLQLRDSHQDTNGVRVVLAVPETALFYKYIHTVKGVLRQAEIDVWFVSDQSTTMPPMPASHYRPEH
jgi:hypothetical protein